MSALITAASSGGVLLLTVLYLVVVVLVIAGWWKVLVKAGRPGWGILIPFYNVYLLCKVAGRPGWWLILFLIPIVNIVIGLIVMIDIAAAFAKSAAYGVGLYFLSFIFGPMLGFSDATYTGPVH
jgi:hypothetical protein